MIEHLADDRGVFLRRDAVAYGVDDRALLRLRRAGLIRRLRQGGYAMSDVYLRLDEAGRHLALTRAVARLYGDDVAVSHVSAALELGAPTWGLPLTHVHLTDLYGQGERTQASVVHHHGALRVADLTRWQGHWMTTPARTALDVAALVGRDAAVVLLDDFLHRGLTTRAELDRMMAARTDWPTSLTTRLALSLADEGGQSVLESLSRLFIGDVGLPVPELQVPIHDHRGDLIGELDFLWREQGVMGECDGLGKYLRSRRPGETVEQTVVREKLREDALREATGWAMVRWTWSDLQARGPLQARLRRALRMTA